jgi:hypothetical protein
VQPLVDDGWFMARDDRVLLSYVDQRITPESFKRHLSALANDIDEWPVQTGLRGVLYESPAPAAMSADQRRQLADVLDARKAKLQSITAGYVMVTPSAVVRGILTAVFWIAPPPYPYRVVATPDEGFQWLATQCPWLDVTRSVERYLHLRSELLGRMSVRGRSLQQRA